MLLMNVQGLYPLNYRQKIGILQDEALNSNCQLILLSETHLHENILNAEIQIDGFSIFRADRQEDIKGGGVAIYVSDLLSKAVETVSSGSNGLVEWITIFLRDINMLIINVYRSPQASKDGFNACCRQISRDIEAIGSPTPTLIMGGDFNFPQVDWQNSDLNIYRNQTQLCDLLSITDTNFMTQCVSEPTRQNNILDLIFTNYVEIFGDIETKDTILSDHRMIIASTHISISPPVNESCEQSALDKLNFYNKSINWEQISEDLQDTDWSSEELDAEQFLNKIYEVITEICQRRIPSIKPRKSYQIPHDRRILMRKRNNL